MKDIKVTLQKLNWINRFIARLLALHGLKPEDLGLSRADLMKYAAEDRDIDELIKELVPAPAPKPRKPRM
ncbi:hypothetical protein BIZ83_gp175 [Erwinia phage vB_EamM_ChrisDB]|jgi:hypothetical protein|uniref:hypothetical protein n=1 Tax=Erwinia phage vB_EamM_ChrisDB TaxID=1883371 RepID=UPI00081CDD9D|nr:hypothetical protein BIZ83_gp175 [Erwinia phage vB_EamM_ChrisDB]ANZ48678.1 hypothetical protein CHRISDB_116 [Erwinia phage vB_EamM_ChrisDB]